MRNDTLLVKAISSGRLSEVRRVLESYVFVENEEDMGGLDYALGIACKFGFDDIVRELVERGAKVNAEDNAASNSPISIAVRSGRLTVIRTLLELGVSLPAGMKTGLSEAEISAAQEKYAPKYLGVAVDSILAEWLRDFEEITIPRCVGVDTQILESEFLRDALRS